MVKKDDVSDEEKEADIILSKIMGDEGLKDFKKGLKDAFKKYFMELDRKLGEEQEAKAHRAGAKACSTEAKANKSEAKAHDA